MEDKEFILESARDLKRWEETPRRLAEDYADMTRDELIKFIIYQRERMEESDAARKESDRRISELTDKISELTELLRKSNEATSAMAVQMSGLLKQLGEKDRKIAELQSEVKAGRKSQKGTKGRGDANRPTSHTDVKDGFDGTSASLPAALDVDAEAAADTAHVSATSQKGSRLYRLGKTYRTMDADNRVFHRSDKNKLPDGATVIRTYSRYTYDQKNVVTEHEYEVVVYRDKEGHVLCGYFPVDSEKESPIIESVPGTHAAPGLLALPCFQPFLP